MDSRYLRANLIATTNNILCATISNCILFSFLFYSLSLSLSHMCSLYCLNVILRRSFLYIHLNLKEGNVPKLSLEERSMELVKMVPNIFAFLFFKIVK